VNLLSYLILDATVYVLLNVTGWAKKWASPLWC